MNMQDLTTRALGGLIGVLVVLAALLFIAAGTLDYWQAWVFLAVFSLSTVAITAYLSKNDVNLLERRMHVGPLAERERSQRIIQSFASVASIAVFVVPALDHRFAWSTIPPYVVVLGDVLVGLGFIIIFLVYRENTYTSAIIEVYTGQRVISTGPYAFIRHPMYIGALIMFLGTPLSLGSWWGLLTMVPITVVIVWRLLDEEDYLARNLVGYTEYQRKVRYRLLPFIW